MDQIVHRHVTVTLPGGAGVAMFGVSAYDQADFDRQLEVYLLAYPEDATVRAVVIPSRRERREAIAQQLRRDFAGWSVEFDKRHQGRGKGGA